MGCSILVLLSGGSLFLASFSGLFVAEFSFMSLPSTIMATYLLQNIHLLDKTIAFLVSQDNMKHLPAVKLSEVIFIQSAAKFVLNVDDAI